MKLDNLIQIGHNVQVGENTVSSAQTGIAGTSRVGRNCFLAGQVGIADHVTVGDRVRIGSKSGVDKSIPDGEVRMGYPPCRDCSSTAPRPYTRTCPSCRSAWMRSKSGCAR